MPPKEEMERKAWSWLTEEWPNHATSTESRTFVQMLCDFATQQRLEQAEKDAGKVLVFDSSELGQKIAAAIRENARSKYKP